MIETRLSDVLRSIIARIGGPRAEVVSFDARRLRGGISADEVIAARAEYLDARGGRRVFSCVVKRLAGSARREITVYRRLRRHAFPFAPRVLATEPDGDATLLFLEWIPTRERWPWRRVACAEAVMGAAANLHSASVAGDTGWDYERELTACAEATLDRVEAARRDDAIPIDAASVRALRRMVGGLGAIRREVVSASPFAPTFIHGDLHPGNVVLASRGAGAAPVLLDWGRARRGSPFEDVASWLQTLACWEPEARARHDSLLSAYLRARGAGAVLTPTVRKAVWLAGGSNALAGALLHHVDVATCLDTPRAARARALWVIREWLRIIRRADATWAGAERGTRGASARRTSPTCGAADPSRPTRATRSGA